MKIFTLLIIFTTCSWVSQQSCVCPQNKYWNNSEFSCNPNPSNSNDSDFVQNCMTYSMDFNKKLVCSACQPSYYYDRHKNKCIQTNIYGCSQIIASKVPHHTNTIQEIETKYRLLAAPPSNATAGGQLQAAPPSNATAKQYIQAAPPTNATARGQLQAAPPSNATAGGQLQAAPPSNATAKHHIQAAPPSNASVGGQLQAAPPSNASVGGQLQAAPPSNASVGGQLQAAPPSNATVKDIQTKYKFLAREDPPESSNNDTNINNYYYCNGCVTGYYVSETETECIPYPELNDENYVENCHKYQAENGKAMCIGCNNKFYLQENQCKPYPDTPEKCSLFSISITDNLVHCLYCEQGYALQNNTCMKYQDIVNNCKYGVLQYQSTIFDCQKCESGYYLENGNQNYECKPNPIQGEQGYDENCDHYIKNSQGIQCDSCKDLFYFEENIKTCQATNTTIQNCQYYSSPDMCGNCEFNFELRSKQTKCKKCPYDPNDLKKGNASILNFSLLIFTILAIYMI